jgi:hypothetical protein
VVRKVTVPSGAYHDESENFPNIYSEPANAASFATWY